MSENPILAKSAADTKVVKCYFESYLQMINSSAGTCMFRHLFAIVNDNKIDVLKDGDLSCAFYVSSLLTIWGVIKRPHATVVSTIEDLEKSGWYIVKNPSKGDVLIWEDKLDAKQEIHPHIGFYVGDNQAISNSSTQKVPIKHHWTFDGTRKVYAVFSGKHLLDAMQQ